MNSTTIERQMWDGVQRLIHNYCDIRSDSLVVVAYSPDARTPSSWVVAYLRHLGLEPHPIPMRPLRDNGLRQRLDELLPSPDQLDRRLTILTLESESMSHFDVFGPLLDRYPSHMCNIVRIISAGEHLFTQGLVPTPEELSARNATLLSELMGDHTIRITSSGGSDLRVQLDSTYDWISNRGTRRPGAFTILPAGEIATYPARVDGTLVVDGAAHCNVVTRFDMRTADHPIVIELEDSKVTRFSCDSDVVSPLIQQVFARPHGSQVGELGFGTNFGVFDFSPDNSHVNERRCSVHLGFGQHNQPPSKVAYIEEVHLDLIMADSTVHLEDGRSIDLASFIPTNVGHPTMVRDEDITGDCCSFGYGQLTACSVDGAVPVVQ